MTEIPISSDVLIFIVITSAIVLSVLLIINISLKKKIALTAIQHKQEIDNLIESEKTNRDNLNNKLRKEVDMLTDEHNSEVTQLSERLSSKSDRVNYLEERYKAVIDADASAIVIINNASSDASELLSDAEEYLTHQQKLSDDIVEKSQEQLRTSREKRKEARELLEHAQISAIKRSEKILAHAKKEAEDIALDAYAIRGKEKELTAAIEAMNNTIKGYKDDYMIPNLSVLDDLAEEYAFSDPGRKLKELREEVRRLVKNDLAGTCEYVEENRRIYAVHFVVDAFNGKVDSAFAKLKFDNYGKIKQQIKDAFALVNHNGASFRNARITDTFLQVRLDELKWAVAVHELRQQELQEQREHKEQIKEESRAKREYDEALKKAEREERLIEEAIKEATAKMQAASAEERAQYESNIVELQQRLVEADAASQRALSMAQQTRRGHVYVISNIGSFGERVFKIGMTRRLEPMDRVKELGDASVPFTFDVHAMIYSEDAPALETHLHRVFNEKRINKVNTRKEFFSVTIGEIKEAIQEKGEFDIHWTLKAKAEEYYETLQLQGHKIAG
jgi:chromosome segregation ATPase